MRLEFHPAIAPDVAHIMEYYKLVGGRSLAADFYRELCHGFERAVEYPFSFRVRSHDFRRVDLKRFPFHFLFRFIPPVAIRILAVRHHRQKSVGRADDELLSNVWSIEGMKFIPVESRMILGLRYNDKTNELDVVFRTGDKYRYKNVPRSVYEELITADSHGRYMHKNILGRYDYERLS